MSETPEHYAYLFSEHKKLRINRGQKTSTSMEQLIRSYRRLPVLVYERVEVAPILPLHQTISAKVALCGKDGCAWYIVAWCWGILVPYWNQGRSILVWGTHSDTGKRKVRSESISHDRLGPERRSIHHLHHEELEMNASSLLNLSGSTWVSSQETTLSTTVTQKDPFHGMFRPLSVRRLQMPWLLAPQMLQVRYKSAGDELAGRI